MSLQRDSKKEADSPHFSGGLAITAGVMAGAALSFVNQWLLARYYGPFDYGAFSVAWATSQLLFPLMVLGIPRFILQRFKNEGALARRWLIPSFKLMGFLGALLAASFYLWLTFSMPGEITMHAGEWLAFWLLLMVPVIAVYSRFQVEGNILFLVIWPLAQIFPRTLAIGTSILLGWPIDRVALGFVVVTLPLSTFSSFKLRRMLDLTWGASWKKATADDQGLVPGMFSILRLASPFGMAEILDKVEFKLIIPLVAYLMGNEAAGLVSVAVNILMAIYLLPSSLFQRYLLPYLHQWAAHDPERKKHFLRRTVVILGLGGLTISPVLWLASECLVLALFGAPYSGATVLLKILSLAIPIWLISTACIHMFLSLIEIRRLVVIQVSCVAVTIAFTITMIPLIGLAAAALALLTGRLLFVLFAGFVAKTAT